jgi:hypothetical protein
LSITGNVNLTFAGTTGTTMTFPGASDTVVTLTASQTLTNKSIGGSQINSGQVAAANGGTGISTASASGVAQVNSGTWSVSTTLANGTKANTQTTGDNSTDVATDAFVQNSLANVLTTPSTTVGQTGVWAHNGTPLGFLASAGAQTPTQSTMYFYQLNLAFPQVIGHFTIYVSTGVASEVFYVCLYNSAGSSVLWSANTAVATNAVAATGSNSQYTATPGSYILAYEETGGLSAAAIEGLSNNASLQTLLNKNGSDRLGTTTNTITSGSCPSMTGTLIVSSTVTPMLIALEP